MKQCFIIPVLFISLSAIGQTKIDVSFVKDLFIVTRSAEKDLLVEIPVNISNTSFPPCTYLQLKVKTKGSTLPEEDYELTEPAGLSLNSFGHDKWTIILKIKPDSTKKELQRVLKFELFLKNECNKEVVFVDKSKTVLSIVINPVPVVKKEDSKSIDWTKDTTNTQKTEIVQYTDFLGFGNDRPNGIFQQQFLFKWPVIRDEFSISPNFKIQPLRSVLLPSILFNRIDKAKDDSSLLYPVGYTIRQIDTSTKDTSLSPVVSTFDLIRYTSLKIEGKIVLLAVTIYNTRIYFDYQFGLLRNKVLDTISSAKKEERFIYSFQSGVSMYIKSLLDSKTHLNIEIETGLNHITLKDNFFKQYDVYKIDNDGKKSIAFPANERFNKTSKPIYYGIITLRKDWGENNKNSAFFRIKYQNQNGQYKFYAKERPGSIKEETYSNHFLQLNLGISLELEKLFSN